MILPPTVTAAAAATATDTSAHCFYLLKFSPGVAMTDLKSDLVSGQGFLGKDLKGCSSNPGVSVIKFLFAVSEREAF